MRNVLVKHFEKLLGSDQVADINFGYNNGMSIDTLRLRGEFMMRLDHLNHLLRRELRKRKKPVPVRRGVGCCTVLAAVL